MPDLLRTAIERALPRLEAISDADARLPRTGRNWTRKQELGHLLDSAANNHVRIANTALHDDWHDPGYDQNLWVALHDYGSLPWAVLVRHWADANLLLAHLVDRIPRDRLGHRCTVGTNETMTLEELIADYVRHMEHHLAQLRGSAAVPE